MMLAAVMAHGWYGGVVWRVVCRLSKRIAKRGVPIENSK